MAESGRKSGQGRRASGGAPRRRWTTDVGAATRQALIEAAIDHIAEFGVLASTTTRIADRAGVSRGSLQHHFQSRDELLLAVVESAIWPDIVEDVDELARRPLQERVEHFYAYYEGGTLDNRFAAAMNLARTLDPESELSAHLGQLLERTVRSNGAIQARIFADIEITPEDMLSVVRTTLAMIEGANRPRGRLEPRLDRPRIRRIQLEMLTQLFQSRRRDGRGS